MLNMVMSAVVSKTAETERLRVIYFSFSFTLKTSSLQFHPRDFY